MQYVENTVIARRLCVVVKSYIFALQSQSYVDEKIIFIKLLLNQVIDMFFTKNYKRYFRYDINTWKLSDTMYGIRYKLSH